MSKSELQTINQQNKLALWSEQIADCRGSGQTVSQWCAASTLVIALLVIRLTHQSVSRI